MQINESQCVPTGREKQNGMEGGSEKAETSSEAVKGCIMKKMHNRVILLLNWLLPCILSSFASELVQ